MHWPGQIRIFVNSLSDLFHADMPEEFIAMVFAVMALAPQHTFQLLTKRHARMRSVLNQTAFVSLVQKAILDISRDHLKVTAAAGDDLNWPLLNVWVGVSVDDQRWVQIRIPALLDTPAAIRWLSCEPLLGQLVHRLDGTDWVVAGGETGVGARAMHVDWARSLRDQCLAAGVPFHFKQWGDIAPYDQMTEAGRAAAAAAEK